VSYTLDQRREILASMPWVAVSPPAGVFNKRCEGYRTDTPLYIWRAIRSPDMADDPALDKWRCTKRARWVYLDLEGEIHIYCWHHLFTYGLDGSPEEWERYQTWLAEYLRMHPEPPDWDDQEPDMPLSRR
jgi:hypothetical protein